MAPRHQRHRDKAFKCSAPSGCQIGQVLVPNPSHSSIRRRRITAELHHLGITLLQVTSIDYTISNHARTDALRTIAIEELLCRGIAGECACVTVAGVSLVSELSPLILKLTLRRLVLKSSTYKTFAKNSRAVCLRG